MKRTVRAIRNAKGDRQLVCLTAYTGPVARAADSHADLVLVGDSLGMVLYEYPNTIPVTLDMMCLHGEVVARVCERACVVVDMPFASYQECEAQAFGNAARLLKETGCDAVKLEGGAEMAPTIRFLVERGIPVLGHVGLMPQHVRQTGYRKVADMDRVMRDAEAVEAAGAFAVILECVGEEIAAAVTGALEVPVIGIGSGGRCDGQIAVTEDLLGLTAEAPVLVPKLVDLSEAMSGALGAYAEHVRTQTLFKGDDRA